MLLLLIDERAYTSVGERDYIRCVRGVCVPTSDVCVMCVLATTIHAHTHTDIGMLLG